MGYRLLPYTADWEPAAERCNARLRASGKAPFLLPAHAGSTPPPVMRRLQAGAARLPVPADVPVARAAGLPHYSILRCTDGDDTRLAVSGAAVYTPGGWMFPVHELAADDVQAVRPLLDDALVERALLPLGAKPALPRRWRREQL